jgi:hypothetical protein
MEIAHIEIPISNYLLRVEANLCIRRLEEFMSYLHFYGLAPLFRKWDVLASQL